MICWGTVLRVSQCPWESDSWGRAHPCGAELSSVAFGFRYELDEAIRLSALSAFIHIIHATWNTVCASTPKLSVTADWVSGLRDWPRNSGKLVKALQCRQRPPTFRHWTQQSPSSSNSLQQEAWTSAAWNRNETGAALCRGFQPCKSFD